MLTASSKIIIHDFVYSYDKFGNLAARKDSINKVEETFTYYRTDSSQSFNRYAYCVYNPLKYTDPSGYLCDNPPYQQQVTRYLMCMNDENAESLNNAGIDNVQVSSSNGCSGSYVSYQQGGGVSDYNKNIDVNGVSGTMAMIYLLAHFFCFLNYLYI